MSLSLKLEAIRSSSISPETYKENEVIKRKLKEYESTFKIQHKETFSYSVSHNQLENRFNDISTKIDTLLSNELEIESINPMENYRVALTSGNKKQYRSEERRVGKE